MTLSAFVPSDFQKAMDLSLKEANDAWSQGANMNAGTLTGLMSIKRNYPWLASGSALSMAQFGYNGYSPEVATTAHLDLKRQLRDNQFSKLMNAGNDDLQHKLSHMSAAEFNAYTPDQRQQLRHQMVSSFTDGGGSFGDTIGAAASDLSYSFSRAAHGDFQGAVAGAGSETATPSDTELKVGPVNVTGAAKATTRQLGAIANTGLQIPLAGIRSAAHGVETAAQGKPDFSFFLGDPKGKEGEAAATDVGQQVKAGVEGRDPFATGQGYLPDPNSPIGRGQAEAARAQGALIDGHAFTLGRGVAAGLNEIIPNTIFQPGEPGFNVVSGVVDATVALKTDPTAHILNQYSEARAGRKFFSPTTAEQPIYTSGADFVDTALRDAGHTFTSQRYGLPAKTWDKMLVDAPSEYFNTVEQHFGPDIAQQVSAAVGAHNHNAAAYDLAKNTGINLGDSPTTTGPTVEQFVGSQKVRPTLQTLTDESSPYKNWLNGGKEWDLPTSKAFGQASTLEETAQVILDHAQSPGLNGPFSVPTPGGFGYSFKRGLQNTAAFGMLPDVQFLQPLNGEETFKALDSIRQESHISVEQAAPIMDEFIKNTGSLVPGAEIDARLRSIKAMGKLIEQRMLNVGTDPKTARELTDFMNITAKNGFEFTDQLIADQQRLPFNMVIGGEPHSLPDPELTAQWGNDAMEIPLAKDLRNATSNAAKLLNSPAYRATSTGLDFFMQALWKPLHLLRPELGLRILLDSQASLAANGYDSLFTHPIRYISMMIGQENDGIIAKALDKLHLPGEGLTVNLPVPGANLSHTFKGIESSYIVDGAGEPLIDSANMGLQHKLYGGLDNVNPVRASLKGQRLVPITDVEAPKGLAQSLQRFRGDPVVKGVLAQASPKEAMDWFWSGEGTSLREALVEPTQRLNNASIAYQTKGMSPLNIDLTTQAGSDAFISNILTQVTERTGNHPELIDALRTGEINGVSLWKNNRVNKNAVNQLQLLIEQEMANPTSQTKPGMTGFFSNEPEEQGLWDYTPQRAGAYSRGHKIQGIDMPAKPLLPEQVTADIPISRSKAAQQRYFSDKAMEAMFNAVLTNPDVKVDRIPAFAQTLWGTANKVGTIERIAPYLSVEDYQKLLANAEKANLPAEVLDRLGSKRTLLTRDARETAYSGMPENKVRLFRGVGGAGGGVRPGEEGAIGRWWTPSYDYALGYAKDESGNVVGKVQSIDLSASEFKSFAARENLPTSNFNELRNAQAQTGAGIVGGYSPTHEYLSPEGFSRIPTNIDTTAERVPLPIAMGQANNEAMDRIVNLVHDLHSRSQFGDMTRILFPFGDAFRRVATRWATTAWDNPSFLRRMQQGLQGAQESGFFHKDPQSGQYVFTYPGSSWLTDKIIGIPIPLQGQVKGLSMVGEGVPGVGPAVSLPAQWFLPDTPQYDTIRKLIFPMGAPTPASGPIQDIVGSVEPAWFSKIVTGPPDQKAFNDTVGAMMNYLASTGSYDLHGDNAQAEATRLMQDAKSKARIFYVIRGAAQAVSPTSPSPSYQIKDKTGRLQVLNVVKSDYYKHMQKDGPQAAMKWMFDNYGPENMFIAQPTSAPIGYAVPVTHEGQNWARENSDVKKAYPSTYGFFAPSSKKDKFDIVAYEDQFQTGERKSLTPQDQSDLANSRVGLYLFHKARDKFIRGNLGDPLTHMQSDLLAAYKTKLMDEYPGFNLITYDTSRLPKAIKELTAAANDPKLMDTDTGKGLAEYLQVRDRAMGSALLVGLKSPFKARSALGIREALRQQAADIVQEHPSFGPMWEQIWSHELAHDVEL